MNFTNKYKIRAEEKVVNEFVEEAAETLPLGPPAGDKLGKDPVDGTTEDLGVVTAPSMWGAGADAGANIESLFTVEGGAIRGGNCCGPALFQMQHQKNIMKLYMVVHGNEMVTSTYPCFKFISSSGTVQLSYKLADNGCG